MSSLDDRLSAALRARADQVDETHLRPALPPSGPSRTTSRRVRWIAPVVAAAAVAGIAITIAAVTGGHHPEASVHPGGSPSTTPTNPAPTSPAPTSPASTTVAASTAPPSRHSPAPGGTVAMVCFFADASPCRVPAGYVWYEPLWPYPTYSAARAAISEKTVNPWTFDANQVALLFAQDYLGFTDITRVTSSTITADEAHIGVGYLDPVGKPVTAAVLHLVRYEQYPATSSAPWEVVGSDDTTLSLERPAYDSSVGGTFTAGGHITGVDESLTLTVRSQTSPLTFTRQGVPAGGTHSPWSITAHAPISGVVTIVVSTGGHVQQHERFAIQGVTVTSSS